MGAARFAIWFAIGLVVGFVAFKVAGERYRVEIHSDAMALRDRWTGKLYLQAGNQWREIK